MEGIEVFKKDGEGIDYALFQHEYNGEPYYLVSGFVGPRVLLPALNKYKPHKDDIWLHTYEKAGTHWVYEIIGILSSGELEPCVQTKMEEFIEMNPATLQKDGPGILNTHMAERYIPKSTFEKTKSIIVVRNPKSVVVSAYYFTLRREDLKYSGTFNGFLAEFNQNGAFGEYSGTWYTYYITLWEKYKHNANVLFVFYEDLKKDPVAGIQKISEFLGLNRDRAFIEGVAKLTTFEHMQKDHSKKKIKWDLPIYRKGEIDDWKNEFTVAQNEEFDKDYAKRMENYPELAAHIQFK